MIKRNIFTVLSIPNILCGFEVLTEGVLSRTYLVNSFSAVLPNHCSK